MVAETVDRCLCYRLTAIDGKGVLAYGRIDTERGEHALHSGKTVALLEAQTSHIGEYGSALCHSCRYREDGHKIWGVHTIKLGTEQM